MISALIAEFLPYAVAIAGALGGVLGLVKWGEARQRDKRRAEDAEASRETRRRMDAVDGIDDDPGTLREFLRSRGIK